MDRSGKFEKLSDMRNMSNIFYPLCNNLQFRASYVCKKSKNQT